MDLVGLFLWIGMIIASFLGYQTGNKWLGRSALFSLLLLVGGLGYMLSGGELYTSFVIMYGAIILIHFTLLVLSSCLISKRFVPDMTWLHLGGIGLIGYGLSQGWALLTTGTWEWARLVSLHVLTSSLIVFLCLLLLVSLKVVDRRSAA